MQLINLLFPYSNKSNTPKKHSNITSPIFNGNINPHKWNIAINANQAIKTNLVIIIYKTLFIINANCLETNWTLQRTMKTSLIGYVRDVLRREQKRFGPTASIRENYDKSSCMHRIKNIRHYAHGRVIMINNNYRYYNVIRVISSSKTNRFRFNVISTST